MINLNAEMDAKVKMKMAFAVSKLKTVVEKRNLEISVP